MPTKSSFPDALARAVSLLEPGLRPARPSAPEGYLDLLAGAASPERDVAVLGRIAQRALGPRGRDEHRIARLLLGLRPGDGVLDVACGSGVFTREFAAITGPAGLAVGIDASAAMLTRAARDTPGDTVAWVRGDATRLPFRDGAFDAVCCFSALHLFAEPLVALDHMTRVLTPGGRLALFTTCRVRSAPLGRLAGTRLFDHDELVGALQQRGFVNVHQRVRGLTQFVGGRIAGTARGRRSSGRARSSRS